MAQQHCNLKSSLRRFPPWRRVVYPTTPAILLALLLLFPPIDIRGSDSGNFRYRKPAGRAFVLSDGGWQSDYSDTAIVVAGDRMALQLLLVLGLGVGCYLVARESGGGQRERVERPPTVCGGSR